MIYKIALNDLRNEFEIYCNVRIGKSSFGNLFRNLCLIIIVNNYIM